MADTYEGWSNRETWATNLWLANDHGLYNMVYGEALRIWDETDEPEPGGPFTRERIAVHELADWLEQTFDEWAHGDGDDNYAPNPGIYKMLDDIGSLYRVDWDEVAGGWITDAMDELKRGGGR